MRTWQVERRKRTRHLIELGGLVVKARIVELTSDNRATIYGALLWIADKLQSDQGEYARKLWTAKGKRALEADLETHGPVGRSGSSSTDDCGGRPEDGLREGNV
ncbi:conjugal transfer protein TraD [Bradyrhizobium sp. HKCCYLRH1073]|uniref:conjugal transfer protein TraD n=1 Tax=unclassified Bradyrhizobium TaxID=2631580 RepID=UPI002916909F|nr:MULTISPECIES: conjugal transfer protein TraD [unclassified Bradyrhizobium]